MREQLRRSHLEEAATQARLSDELARPQYTEDLADFQAVLVSERALAELEDDLATSESTVTTDLVAPPRFARGDTARQVGRARAAGRGQPKRVAA